MQIKNLLFQPLSFNAAPDNEGFHLYAREFTEIPDEKISDEIRLAAERGLIALINVLEEPNQEPTEFLAAGEVLATESMSLASNMALDTAEADTQTIIKKGTRK